MGSLIIYPNPVYDVLNISNPTVINFVKIYNFLGQCLFNTSPNGLTSSINMTQFTAGTYFVEIDSEAGKKITKVIKK
jgi:hypothetical protein